MPRQVSRAGKSFGLVIEMYLGDPNLQSFNFIDPTSAGAYLQVHEPNKKINFIEAIDIQPSMKTSIGVSKVKTKKLLKPYSSCLNLDSIDSFDSDLYRAVFQENSYFDDM